MAKVTYDGSRERTPLPSLHDMLGRLVMCGCDSAIYIVGMTLQGYIKINLRTGMHWCPPTNNIQGFWESVIAILPEGAKVILEQE